MYNIQPDMMRVTQNDTLRTAAQDQLRAQASAARRARNRSNPAHRLANLFVLRGRRAAQAY